MIQNALREYYDSHLSGCFFDCFGILVKPITVESKTYPIATEFDCPECEANDHSLLVPDESRRSIAYFQQSGALSIDPSNLHSTKLKATVPLNLVVWYNIKKLGYDTMTLQQEIFSHLLKITEQANNNSLDTLYLTGLLQDNPFAQFNYESNCINVYPYEWLNIRCEFSFHVDIDCLELFTCQDPIC